MPFRVGVQLWQGGAPDYAAWRSAVLDCEQLGVDTIFGYDHFHRPALEGIVDATAVLKEDQEDVTNFEGWTALASWGEVTTRADIGLLVSGMGYRNPDLLADMARTVDHISDGRLILGVGVGWYEKDYTTYGYDYGTVTTRLDAFAGGLRRIQHRLRQLNPPPIRRIPILIGGGGERRTLPLVARFADIWHVYPSDIDSYRRKSALVDEVAESVGRLGGDIERSVAWSGERDADVYAGAGATHFILPVRPSTDAGYDLTEVRRALAWRDAQTAAFTDWQHSAAHAANPTGTRPV
jgi:probable F420-dependent oxidoreductase